MSAPLKLTAAQRRMLEEGARQKDGFIPAPGGYKGAGPDASRFYRTARVLSGHGFVRLPTEAQGAYVTDAGRAALSAAGKDGGK